MFGDGDFTFEETQVLEDENVFKAKTTTGKRKVSAALLSPPTATRSISSATSSSSLSSTATVRMMSFNEQQTQQGSLEMPTALISAAALEFIGFVPATAEHIFKEFLDRPDPDINCYSFLDYATGYVGQLVSNYWAYHVYHEAMTRVGLTTDFQERLMDPRFKAILDTETLLFWILDTLKTNYATLEQLQGRLKHHASHVMITRSKNKAKRASVQGAFSELAAAPPEITATVSQTVSQTWEGHSLPTNFIAVQAESATPIPPNHMVLYKGKAADEIQGPWIRDDGSVDMAIISTMPGGDFNRRSIAHYWTPQRSVAEEYRAWAARRCSFSETWVVRICIPMNFINSITRKELWYSPDWKDYVWFCRKKEQLPAKFDFLKNVDVIQGHICTKLSPQITRIKKENLQATMDESFAIRDPSTGSKAIQWAFIQDNTIDRLGLEIRGRIHIDITPVVQTLQGSTDTK